MSAIWGIVSFKNNISKSKFEIMNSYYRDNFSLDDYRSIEDDNLYMGCGIQHITKESINEKLPLKGDSICFNSDCILDNREELLSKLCISDSNIPDGSLMYYAYLKWGIDCVKYFRGLYSIAVFDYRENCLYLASDPVSSRCLYYYISGNNIIFSTLLKPIITIENNITLNDLYLKDFLIAPGLMPNLSPNETPYKNVFKQNPGCYLKITNSEIKEFQYWDITVPLTGSHCKTASDYGSYFMNLYSTCVKDATKTLKKVGIAMSSGLDSSSIGVLAAKELSTQKKQLYSYTYVPAENVSTSGRSPSHVLDETEDVKEIVSKYPNIIPHFLNNSGKNAFSELDKVLDILEIPVKAFINFPNLCELCHKANIDGCKVILTGQTGNQTVSYGKIDHIMYDLLRNKKYFTFLVNWNNYSKKVGESRKKAFKYYLDIAKEANIILQTEEAIFSYDNPFLTEKVLENYPIKERFKNAEITYTEIIPTCQEEYQKQIYRKSPLTYLGEYETKLGLKYNVILRDPTKDERILRFCYHLPYQLFANKGTPRWLINGLFKDLLPDSLLNNWTRHGIQNADWTNRILRDWEQLQPEMSKVLSQPYIKQYIDIGKTQKILNGIQKVPATHLASLLSYLVYLCVMSKFISSNQNDKF